MDGVLTKTAAVHSAAWKRMFDEYLRRRSTRIAGEAFHEFTHAHDYLRFVDGRPRYRGVEAFLASRGVALPFGTPDDPTGLETVCGLGNRKNELFNEILRSEGVEVYDSTLTLIAQLRDRGVRIGLATSSKNSALVLEKSGTRSLFSAVIDGLVSEKLGLHGKPAPDIFLAAANALSAAPDRTIVVEDAASGVRAAADGEFVFVIGVAREGNAKELRDHGADLVVGDLSEIHVDFISQQIRTKRRGR